MSHTDNRRIPKTRNHYKISPADTMLKNRESEESISHYFGVGLSAISAVQEILNAEGVTPNRILDLPCGFGRVLRVLQAVYPWAAVVHADLNTEGVDFCSAAFGTEAVYSKADFRAIEFPNDQAEFDLIWVGSLLTHLPEKRSRELLECITGWLSEDGIAVVTSHGDSVADRFRSGTHPALTDLKLDEGAKKSFLDSYELQGYGHVNYPRQTEYGISLTDIGWFETVGAEVGLRIVEFFPEGWDIHQDIVGMCKV